MGFIFVEKVAYDVLAAAVDECLETFMPGVVEYQVERQTPGSVTYRMNCRHGDLGTLVIRKLSATCSQLDFSGPPKDRVDRTAARQWLWDPLIRGFFARLRKEEIWTDENPPTVPPKPPRGRPRNQNDAWAVQQLNEGKDPGKTKALWSIMNEKSERKLSDKTRTWARILKRQKMH